MDIKDFGEKEVEWLNAQINAFWDSAGDCYEYVDNHRTARLGHPESVAEYEERKRNGCCGYCDVEFGPSPEGHTYLYGFNHGH